MAVLARSKQVLGDTRHVLETDRKGRPRCRDARRVLEAIEAVLRSGEGEVVADLVENGILRAARTRHTEYIAPHMQLVAGARYEMGTPPAHARHFCGESPCHVIELPPYWLSETSVTNGLFSLFDPRRSDLSRREREKPAVDVTWWEAALFAMWVGCRLPTEAEWEYACGAGGPGEWCCPEDRLARYAWYSENADDRLHRVASLEPNAFGLFDLHGNVWEWCKDVYDQDYYQRSPARDPVNNQARGWMGTDRVARGGSLYALAEMCRTRYRFHEPAEFCASDLGFRLAQTSYADGLEGP